MIISVEVPWGTSVPGTAFRSDSRPVYNTRHGFLKRLPSIYAYLTYTQLCSGYYPIPFKISFKANLSHSSGIPSKEGCLQGWPYHFNGIQCDTRPKCSTHATGWHWIPILCDPMDDGDVWWSQWSGVGHFQFQLSILSWRMEAEIKNLDIAKDLKQSLSNFISQKLVPNIQECGVQGVESGYWVLYQFVGRLSCAFPPWRQQLYLEEGDWGT